ncbi:MAG TPA: hypothetical protein VFL99_00190 [Segeticoccus sp.]|uniref:WD40/YVTN/BNR-like repeat-containing protein n=1 Tax=Segeticoccus sp. TaxID=2706531 RepID=UPI002D7F9638|nr:hypothetical protein [Segeticoccus sp.]HET8598714.1 hypothetical protein [Segeticoccus sp.]
MAAAGGSGTANPLRGVAAQEAHQHAQPSSASAATATEKESGEPEGDALEVADRAEQYAYMRSAPAESVSAAALLAARAHVAAMPSAGTHLTEVTRQPLQAEPAGYTDPYWSNAGSGFDLVSGRVTGLAVDGQTTYVGAADGGVWKSVNGGRTWGSIWDHMPSLSIGALTMGPGHALWIGTGEANTNSDSYQGIGVYRTTNGGRTFQRVGGDELVDSQIYRIRDDHHGWMYAATSHGLYRHSSTTSAGSWQLVLKPDPNPDHSPYRTSMITDLVIRPGTHGQELLAVLGWRNGSPYNGFYVSHTGGGANSWHEITPAGDIDASDIGRTSLAYAADGSRLYAVIESPAKLLAGDDTNLQGVYVSASGDPAGPWTLIADSDKLDHSGSALVDLAGYHAGIQSWYNQTIEVDPHDPMHMYLGLEEIFQTNNGGQTFTTASPYWNYGLPCGSSCPKTTHPDQHALAITPDGQLLIGNDGGVYRRPLSVVGYGHWSDLNAGLHTLQYYDAGDGRTAGSPSPTKLGYWGGMQDNGTSLLKPHSRLNVEPAGGDGTNVIVDPQDWQRSVGAYVDLGMYSTTDGGHHFDTISPECGYYNGADCDPSARFVAPFVKDPQDVNHWVAGGSKIWETRKGWDTRCGGSSCDWVPVHELSTDGAGGLNVATALATNGDTTYAAWVDSSGNPSPTFQSGIDTNYGGTWHRLALANLPNRYIAGLTVDRTDPAHVYAVFNGYSRRWIEGGGTGVIFESHDGGATWRNITGNLPDAPGDAVAVSRGELVLATDVGAFVSSAAHPGRWTHVDGLPNTAINNVKPSADGRSVVAATHGRGIWTIRVR